MRPSRQSPLTSNQKNADDNEASPNQQADEDASTNLTTTIEGSHSPQSNGKRPSIPPPIVSAAEEALTKATNKAKQDNEEANDIEDTGTTLGIPDQYMKYLTFGLSTLGKAGTEEAAVYFKTAFRRETGTASS